MKYVDGLMSEVVRPKCCLEVMDCEGSSKVAPGANGDQFAQLIATCVFAVELSLILYMHDQALNDDIDDLFIFHLSVSLMVMNCQLLLH